MNTYGTIGNDRWITRQKKGKSVVFKKGNAPITDKQTLDWIESLHIPPAWRSVKVATDQSAKILAKGIDKAGRVQVLYHPVFREQQDKLKYSRVISFGEKLPLLRKRVEMDLRKKRLTKEKVIACIIKLIDKAYFRVGNEKYSVQNNSYGITTLRSRHVDVRGMTVTFDFRGKSGKQQHKQVSDRRIASIIKQLDELPGQELFLYRDHSGSLRRITSQDVNEYIRETTGEAFTAKDFRTWGGTLYATDLLIASETSQAANQQQKKKLITQCVKQVAKRLGNTPTIARKSYIDPVVLERFLAGEDLSKTPPVKLKPADKALLEQDEIRALQILRSIKASP